MWKIIVWSLKVIETGIWPRKDWRGEVITEEPFASWGGTQLAAGYFATMWLFKCDAEYTYNYIRLPGHWSSAGPCHACQCDKTVGSPFFHLNFSPLATWSNTIFSDMNLWRAWCHMRGKSVHPLLQRREDGGLGLNVLCFGRDSMHAVDLGVVPRCLGTVLWLLCFGGYVSVGEPINSMRTVFADINAEYSRRKTKSVFTNIELSQFTDPDSPLAGMPLLTGKAAELRHLVPIVQHLWATKYTKERDPAVAAPHRAHDEHVSEVLRSLADIITLIDIKHAPGRVPMFFTEAASGELRDQINRFLVHNQFLHDLAVAQTPPLRLWEPAPKYHSLWHIGHESQYMHTAVLRCYTNEDFMQYAKRVALAERHGNSTSRRALTITERFALGVSIALWAEEESRW